MDIIRNAVCNLSSNPFSSFQDCLPDCEETHYTASVSAAPFRKCDFKNLGLTALCNIGGSGGGDGDMGEIEPPMWGESVINQYRSVTQDYQVKRIS